MTQNCLLSRREFLEKSLYVAGGATALTLAPTGLVRKVSAGDVNFGLPSPGFLETDEKINNALKKLEGINGFYSKEGIEEIEVDIFDFEKMTKVLSKNKIGFEKGKKILYSNAQQKISIDYKSNKKSSL